MNDTKGLQILYHYYYNIILQLEVANHIYWLYNRDFSISGKRSTVYCRIWLNGSQIIHTCYILLICKRLKTFSKTTPVHESSRSLRVSLKETSSHMKKTWIITQSLNAYLCSCKYLNRSSYFYSYRAENRIVAVIQTCILRIISFTLNFCQKYKKSNRNHDILS